MLLRDEDSSAIYVRLRGLFRFLFLHDLFQTYEVMDGMEQVLTGSFSYITVKSYTKIDIASVYYDKYGNTPIHLSTTEYPVLGGNSWGFR